MIFCLTVHRLDHIFCSSMYSMYTLYSIHKLNRRRNLIVHRQTLCRHCLLNRVSIRMQTLDRLPNRVLLFLLITIKIVEQSLFNKRAFYVSLIAQKRFHLGPFDAELGCKMAQVIQLKRFKITANFWANKGVQNLDFINYLQIVSGQRLRFHSVHTVYIKQ